MLYKNDLKSIIKKSSGFTLIEVLVGVAVFVVVATAVYQAYANLFVITSANQYKILAINAANEQFEIARNLSYADVGEINGIPNGKLPHVQTWVRGGITFTITTTVRNVDLPYDGTLGGTPNDLSPADNKLVEVQIDCSTCKNYVPITLTTTIAPKNLETASTNGALFIKVFDGNGLPVQGADVHIVNTKATTTITIDDVTDINGMLQIVDVPPGVEAYAITISKEGYSTARTYPANGPDNPNPNQVDATVVLQQVTQVSFSIDALSTLSFSSVSDLCTPRPDINFTLTGSKLIGDEMPKYSRNHVTNSQGKYVNTVMEWDSYTVVGTDADYDIIGINPLNAIQLNPNSTQEVMLVVSSKNPKSLLVTVKDSSTLLPVTESTVSVTGPGGYSETDTTGRGYINQTDWSDGSGQVTFVDPQMYFTDDGGVDTDAPNGEIKLREAFGTYSSSGVLVSSTIDTGALSNFYNLVWSPTDQPVETGPSSLKFQFASNAEITATTTWDFKGPDGTALTYYTTANSIISNVHNGDRYVRYKVFLSTDTATSTPNVSDVAFTFASSCRPPGQVVFSGLSGGNYDISVSKSGYTISTSSVMVTGDWTENTIILAP